MGVFFLCFFFDLVMINYNIFNTLLNSNTGKGFPFSHAGCVNAHVPV